MLPTNNGPADTTADGVWRRSLRTLDDIFAGQVWNSKAILLAAHQFIKLPAEGVTVHTRTAEDVSTSLSEISDSDASVFFES